MAGKTEYQVLILGDFNTVLNSELDRARSSQTGVTSTELCHLVGSYRLRDI